MRRAAEIVGAENATVVSNTSELGHLSYMDPSKAHDVRLACPFHSLFHADVELQMFYMTAEDFFISSAVVAPRNIPDVQAIVRLANEFEIPLWTFVCFLFVVSFLKLYLLNSCPRTEHWPKRWLWRRSTSSTRKVIMDFSINVKNLLISEKIALA